VKPETQLGGEVAIEVARQLADPLRSMREKLGLVVDHLERYVATSTGPTPYPWRSLQTLRHDLAEAYLELTQLTRRVDELDQALTPQEPRPFEVSPAVDLGLRLAGHELGTNIELLFDLGNVPPARGIEGQLALLVAQLVGVSAASARSSEGSSLSVRVASEDSFVIVTIADNGAGSERAGELGELARAIVAPWGGFADAASAPGRGCSFEIRLAI
jgi:signal transduction histidine kinase